MNLETIDIVTNTKEMADFLHHFIKIVIKDDVSRIKYKNRM